MYWGMGYIFFLNWNNGKKVYQRQGEGKRMRGQRYQSGLYLTNIKEDECE